MCSSYQGEAVVGEVGATYNIFILQRFYMAMEVKTLRGRVVEFNGPNLGADIFMVDRGDFWDVVVDGRVYTTATRFGVEEVEDEEVLSDVVASVIDAVVNRGEVKIYDDVVRSVSTVVDAGEVLDRAEVFHFKNRDVVLLVIHGIGGSDVYYLGKPHEALKQFEYIEGDELRYYSKEARDTIRQAIATVIGVKLSNEKRELRIR